MPTTLELLLFVLTAGALWSIGRRLGDFVFDTILGRDPYE